MKPTETGSFRIDDEHMKRKKDEDMKKKKEQEGVERNRLFRRRALLVLREFSVIFVAAGWFVSSSILYLLNIFNEDGKDLIVNSIFIPPILFLCFVSIYFVFVEFIIPAFRNVKHGWDG